MSESNDMDVPVTRRELHDTIGEMAGLIKGWLESLETRLRGDIQGLRMEMQEQERRLEVRMQAQERRLMAHIGGRASEVEVASRLTIADDQYQALVGRVVKLETKVFAPPKRKRRAAR